MDREDTVIQQLIQLGKMHDSVRAVILTSSRANPSAPRDVFSDYDVVLYTVDPAPLVAGREWFEALGPVLISIQPGFEESGHWVPTRLVLYENGTKIDFCIRHVDDLRRLADAGHPPDDHGFIVLLDKDGRPVWRVVLTDDLELDIQPTKVYNEVMHPRMVGARELVVEDTEGETQ